MFDDAGLAVHEHVVGVARNHAHLHAAGCEKIVQAAVAFAGEQQIEPVLGRLPEETSVRASASWPRARPWRPSRRMDQDHRCRRRGFRRRLPAPRRPLRATRIGNSRRSADNVRRRAGASVSTSPSASRREEKRSITMAYTRSSFSASASSCAAALSLGRVSWSWRRRIRRARSASGGAASSRRRIQCEHGDAGLGSPFSIVFQTANSTCRSWVLAKPSPSSIRPLRSAAPARLAALAAVEAIRSA